MREPLEDRLLRWGCLITGALLGLLLIALAVLMVAGRLGGILG